MLVALIVALFLPTVQASPAYAAANPANPILGGTTATTPAAGTAAGTGSPVNTSLPGTLTPGTGTGTAATAGAAGGDDASNELVGGLANQALNTLGNFVGTGVAYAVTATLSLVLSGDKVVVFGSCDAGQLDCWFSSQFELMKTIAIWVMVPLVLLALIQAISKGSILMMVRSVVIYVPIVFLGTAVAAQFVQLLLYITDDMSRAFITDKPEDLAAAAKSVTTFFSTPATSDSTASLAAAALFKVIMALPMLISAFFVWLILLLRSASIYLATLFLPIGFATLVWPAASRQFRKLAQFLIAMILSKLVMVAGLAVGIASFTQIGNVGTTSALDGTQVDAAAATAAGGNVIDFTILNQTVLFLAIFLITAMAPTMLMKFLDNFSFGEAAQAISNHHKRPGLVSQILFVSRLQGIGNQAKSAWQTTTQAIPERQKWAAQTSPEQARLWAMGVTEKRGPGREHGFEITDEDFEHSGIAERHKTVIQNLSYSNNANDWAVAHMAFAAQGEGWNLDKINADPSATGGVLSVERSRILENGKTERQTIMAPTIESNGKLIINEDPALVRRAASMAAAKMGSTNVLYMSANPGGTARLQNNLRDMDDASKQGDRRSYFTVVGTSSRSGGAVIGNIRSQINNTGLRSYFDSSGT